MTESESVMSEQPSAFDVLMSKSKKKTNPQTSKRIKIGETVNPELAKTLVPISRVSLLKSRIGLLKKSPSEFDPEKVSCWEKGERVPFMFLSLAFDLISTETGRTVITDSLCNMFRTIILTTPEDLLPTVYLAANEITPAHQGLKLGLGKGSSIVKAIAEAFGRVKPQVEKQYTLLGDLGLVAQGCRSSQTMIFMPKPLTVLKVADTLRQIANESGKGSEEKKMNLMKALLVAETDCEPLYLTRLLQEKLRLGFSRLTVLAALEQAAVYNEQHSKPPKNTQDPLDEAAKIVKQVFSVLPVFDSIVGALLTSGVWNLPKTCNITLGVPVRPMCAVATTSVGAVLDKFEGTVFTCEYKYDGERAQIHYVEKDRTLDIFSRNGERNTDKYPDVVNALLSSKKSHVNSFILDCEVVAFDREKMKIVPFQILSTRARKNVNVCDIKVGVCIYAFDMLYLNGQLLIQENLNTRREKLYDSFSEAPGHFEFATALTSSDVGEIQEFLKASVDIGCEGLMIKTLYSDATYEPAKRTNNWLKLKDSFGDSVDLVPIAAFHGHGKRTGSFGAFLLACYDVDKDEFQSVCKIGTGFSEVEIQELSTSLCSDVIATPKQYYQVDESLNPDVWFEPTKVWEVKAADLTISPVHRAAIGIVDPNKGISLRFPRLVRVPDDKKPEEATSSDQIAKMYLAQKHNQPSNEAESEDD